MLNYVLSYCITLHYITLHYIVRFFFKLKLLQYDTLNDVTPC